MDNNVLENILEANETKLWEGKPDLRSFVFFRIPALVFIIPPLFIGIILIIISFGLLFNDEIGECTINGKPGSIEECTKGTKIGGIFLFITGLTILIVSAGGVFIIIFLYPYLKLKVTKYIVTDKRVILKSGFIFIDKIVEKLHIVKPGIMGGSINSVYYEQIKSIYVDVGLAWKIFGTGDISINAGKIEKNSKGRIGVAYSELTAIDKPYEVYNLIQKQQNITKNSVHSGRADYKYNTNDYKEFIQETEKMKREIY